MNSFQKRVPTGKSQRSTSRASIVAPAGSLTQRDLRAPSLQSGYCGENGRFSGSIASRSPSVTYSPVCDSSRGGRALPVDAAGDCTAAAIPTIAAIARANAFVLISTAYRELLTAYCLLPTAYCLLPTNYCPSGGSIGAGTRLCTGGSDCRYANTALMSSSDNAFTLNHGIGGRIARPFP